MSTSAPRWGILPLALCVLLPACARPPRQQPLDPDAVLASVRAEREEAPTPEGRPLTLAEATALLRRANPSIREARATWQIAEALAQTKTPMPNPTIALGPLFFGGGNLLDMATTGFAAAVGWAMPTKNPPRLNDTVNRVRADAAFTRALATERSAYLGLRAAMAEALLGQREQEVVSAIGDATKAATRVGRDLAEAGQRTALDVRLLELEVAQNRATMIAVRGRARRSQHEVAAMLGRRPSSVNLAGGDLPALALELPEVAAVEKAAIAGHPRLAVLRAEYILAEKLLRQQAARANPGITFGAGFER
ncbi:MAG: hypothetical protein P1V36_10210, partial [Planctomycetota bacterium]|nr:hypothetical protein [Planctomycetota bacterium]